LPADAKLRWSGGAVWAAVAHRYKGNDDLPRRYFLIGFVALIVAVGLIGWHFFGGQGEPLKPDGGPVVTVMDSSSDTTS
jgi:hypothetical protein